MSSDSTCSPRSTAWRLCILLLIAAGLAVYAGSLRGPFIFDELRMITQNPRVQSLHDPVALVSGTARPLAFLTLALNHAIGGFDPRGYHAFNVLVHLTAGLVLFGLLRRTLMLPRCGLGADAACWVACIASGLWLIHPLQTQSVTYIIQRMESLMGLFYLLTLYAVVRGAVLDRSGRSSPTERAAQRARWHALAVLCCAAGMATKEVMATAPLMALAFDRVFLSRSMSDLWRRRGLLHILLWATLLILAGLLVFNVHWPDVCSAGFDLPTFTPLHYVLTQPSVVVHYLGLALWPQTLCLDYLWPATTRLVDAALPLLQLALLAIVTWWALRHRPALGFLGLWFFVVLAPSSSVLPIADPAMEHRMYLPLAAVTALATWTAYAWLWRSARAGVGVSRYAAFGVVSLVGLTLATWTIERNRVYGSRVTVWTDVMIKRPYNPRAHFNLGNALFAEHHFDGARRHYDRALQINPMQAPVYVQLGRLAAEQQDHGAALQAYARACALEPDNGAFAVEYGMSLSDAGRSQQAETQYRRALDIDPLDHAAHSNLGVCLFVGGRHAEALVHLQEAVTLRPDIPMIHTNLGRTLDALGRATEARRCYEKALALTDTDFLAHRHLAALLMRMGEATAAREHLELTLELVPECGPAHRQLAEWWAAHDRPDMAAAYRAVAERLRPAAPPHAAQRRARLIGAAITAQGTTHDPQPDDTSATPP